MSILLSPTSAECDADQGEGKEVIDGRGYKVFEAATFDAARAGCRKLNMDLLHFKHDYTLIELSKVFYGKCLSLKSCSRNVH